MQKVTKVEPKSFIGRNKREDKSAVELRGQPGV